MVDVDVIVGDGWQGAWEVEAPRAVRAAIAVTPHAGAIASSAHVEVAVKLSDDAEVRALNAQWRGKDMPTNVLSFPMVQADLIDVVIGSDEGETLLGDIILARETCEREARDRGISANDHAMHLIVHGTLHLLGHDHQNDAEAEHMEALETTILASLGLHAPYEGIDDDV